MYLTHWILIVTILGYNPRGDLQPNEMQLENPSIEYMTKSECTQYGIKITKNNPLVTHFTCKEVKLSEDFAT